MTSTLAQSDENIRVRLDLSYNGAAFHGWAAQPNLRTVEGELTRALRKISRCPETTLTVAGRTDAGVHARGQVAHFNLPRGSWERLVGRSDLSPGQALVRKMNALLSQGAPGPKGYSDVVVHSAQAVDMQFCARFSALWRTYTYRIADGARNWDPMRIDVLWVPNELNLVAMNEACKPLLGEHDFLAYCKPRRGASTVRTLYEFGFERAQSGLICARVRADAFCHSQVRTLVGTMIEVGRGARAVSWPAARLESKTRNGEVIVAPAHGLTLEEIGYPQPEDYGKQAQLARRFRGDTELCDDVDSAKSD